MIDRKLRSAAIQVPLAGNEMSLQFAEPVPYLVADVREESVPDYSAAYSLSFAVCALAVAGAAMRKPIVRANRRMRVEAPVMQLRDEMTAVPLSTAQAGSATPGQIDMDNSILVQGGSLRTWSYRSPAVEQVQVVLGTEGRPLDADIELRHG